MSLTIAVHVNEGIVIASDRRLTFTTTETKDKIKQIQIGTHITDTTDKTFLCPNNIGISICGDSSISNKPISGFIRNMILTHFNENTLINDVPNIIIDYFSQFNPIPNSTFLVAGYLKNPSSIIQKLFRVNTATKTIEEIDTSNQGAAWNGEISTLCRLIQPVGQKNSDGTYTDLPYEEILWNYFTLQDAVDFARYSIETTIQTMRFKKVVKTVGGDIDILVITPDEARWIQKAQLH